MHELSWFDHLKLPRDLYMRDNSTLRGAARHRLSGWRLVSLYLYCLMLSTIAAVLAAIIATWPHWAALIGPAYRAL
jgi:hypothetical protein